MLTRLITWWHVDVNLINMLYNYNTEKILKTKNQGKICEWQQRLYTTLMVYLVCLHKKFCIAIGTVLSPSARSASPVFLFTIFLFFARLSLSVYQTAVRQFPSFPTG